MNNRVILQDKQGDRWLHFSDPLQVVTTGDPAEVPRLVLEIETLVEERGLYAAGFLSYEAAPAFDDALVVRPPSGLPLLWFGLYEQPDETIDLKGRAPYQVGEWKASVSRADYDQAVARIKDYIASGATYQVNYTYRLCAPFQGEPWGLFLDLIRAQQPAYAAYVDLGAHVICSASPELFFVLNGPHLSSRPMKGTVERGRTLGEDRAKAEWLHHSEKNRAENVMIVDMIRNDMGRVGEIGSVAVPSLFDVERYPTLWQMTSTVTCRTDASLSGIMAALFPCASITGAPKVSTMGIIAELETSPRGVYTGCVGYIAPGRQAQFNVAIRTVVVDCARGEAEFGVGGGIVWDSGTDSEYAESLTKAQILFDRRPPFQMLESLLWTPEDGYFLLTEHLERLTDSAAYFGYECDGGKLLDELHEFSEGLPPAAQKVRLLLARDGAARLEASAVGSTEPAVVGLARTPVKSEDVFLFHKTTNRAVYRNASLSRPECDEVLLWNERGELTEATTANVVVHLGGDLLTPPVSSGLLAGTFRNHLLAKGIIREQVIRVSDLERCQTVYLVNSVRKWREAYLRQPTRQAG
ncbi:MAG: aminodeoxychorismate synthase component I [Chloroflexota bacterium]|jgi:para-aminobenzoate synthetase/4-amino-4-deoxychorismate lyase